MNFEVGQVLEGTVNNIKNFGIFIKLEDDKIGFCHISKISYKFVSNIFELFSIGDKIKVKIIDIDEDEKISLSIKDTEPDIIPEKQKQPKKMHNKEINIESNIEKKLTFDDLLNDYLKNSNETLKAINSREKRYGKRGK